MAWSLQLWEEVARGDGGVKGYGWGRGDHRAGMSTHGETQPPPLPPPQVWLYKFGEEAALLSFYHVSVFSTSGYVAMPSHPLRASTPTFTKHPSRLCLCVPSSSKGIQTTFWRKHSALGSGATWWSLGVNNHIVGRGSLEHTGGDQVEAQIKQFLLSR